MITQLIAWLRESNRWKHLLGGFAVGVLACGAYAAIYAAAVAASCLELKDRAHGCRWDWIDWALTVVGGAAAATVWTVMS